MQDDFKPRPKEPEVQTPAVTPETTTKAEAPIQNLDEAIVINEEELEVPKKSRLSNLRHFKANVWDNWTKRRKIITSCSALIVVALIGLALSLILANHPKELIPRKAKPVVAGQPTTVASPLSGVQVAPALAQRPVTGIMIENSLDARPQSGLQDAGVVYEAIAEGGITRFLALFQENRPSYIGPVRSLRPYYIDWATPFDASIAHVGGSPEALAQIRTGANSKDLDQFFNSASYWRVPNRPSPHDVYTSFDRLDTLNESKGYITSKFDGWPRSTKEIPLKVPAAKSIDFAISGALYNVHYDYDGASNSYLRSEGGSPHIDLVTADDKAGVQLKPKVVIALVMSYGLEADDHHSQYGVDGSGQMFLFEDGGATIGTWSKANRGSQIKFTDKYGHEVKLNPGQTWITALSGPGQVSYK